MRKQFRQLLSLLLVGLLVLQIACSNTNVSNVANENSENVKEVIKEVEVMVDKNAALREEESERYYIFDIDENVEREHVYYKNRYGIELAGDLYYSKNLNKKEKHMAVVIGPPYGGVKEQGPGVYANELAKRGFVALAFDPSFNGASGGEWRHIASSDIFAEDFSAGVDYLGTLNYVDREKIAVIGICGSGGFALSAAKVDHRIKAVITSALYDIPGLGTKMVEANWDAVMDDMAKQRWEDVDNGYPGYQGAYDPNVVYDELPDDITGLNFEWNTFYAMKRGHHPRSTGGSTFTSGYSLNNFMATDNINKISPRPILFITGDIAHSKEYSEEMYEKAAEPKELYIVEGAMHIDLYDDTTKIPFDKIESFLKENLNK